MYETLYRENAALLRTVAHKYAGACRHDNAVTVDDLMQAGFIGLVRAEKSYRPDKGKSWPCWAAWYIARAMGEALGYRHGRWLKPGTISLDEPIKEDDPEGMTRKDAIADDSLPGMEDKEVGERLRALRGTQSLVAVAVAVGVSPQALEAYEAGERWPRDDVKIRLADYYRQDIEELFY